MAPEPIHGHPTPFEPSAPQPPDGLHPDHSHVRKNGAEEPTSAAAMWRRAFPSSPRRASPSSSPRTVPPRASLAHPFEVSRPYSAVAIAGPRAIRIPIRGHAPPTHRNTTKCREILRVIKIVHRQETRISSPFRWIAQGRGPKCMCMDSCSGKRGCGSSGSVGSGGIGSGRSSRCRSDVPQLRRRSVVSSRPLGPNPS